MINDTTNAATVAYFLKEASERAERGETADSERAARIAANLTSRDARALVYAYAARYDGVYSIVVPSELREEAKRADAEGAVSVAGFKRADAERVAANYARSGYEYEREAELTSAEYEASGRPSFVTISGRRDVSVEEYGDRLDAAYREATELGSAEARTYFYEVVRNFYFRVTSFEESERARARYVALRARDETLADGERARYRARYAEYARLRGGIEGASLDALRRARRRAAKVSG